MGRPIRQTLLCMSVVVPLAVLPSASTQTYKVIAKYPVAGTSAQGIFIDSARRRVFVAGSSGVTVLDADSGASIGVVGDLKNASDVLLLPDKDGAASLKKGFASDEEGHVFLFSPDDLRVNDRINLMTPGPATLCYDKDANTVEAVSRAGSLTSFDADTGKVLHAGRLATGSGQIACGTIDHVYVADPDANVVHVLNHRMIENEGDLPMKSGEKPSGLALDTKGRRLFVTCENGTIEIVDTDAGYIFTELRGGTGNGRSTFAWLPQGPGQWKAAAFTAQADGTLSAARMNAFINYTLGSQSHLSLAFRGIAWDEKTRHLYLTAMDAGSPVVVVAGY